MSHLRVTLDSSLEGDLVILRVDQRDFHRSKVKSPGNILIPIPPSQPRRLSLEVEVPAKGVFGTCGLWPASELAIAVRLEPTGVLAFQVQACTPENGRTNAR